MCSWNNNLYGIQDELYNSEKPRFYEKRTWDLFIQNDYNIVKKDQKSVPDHWTCKCVVK